MVIEWANWPEAEAAAHWDAALTAFPDYNLYQSYGWGEFKRRHGWQVQRGIVLVDGAQEAMAQCFVREIRPARIIVIWVPGGPAGSAAGRLHLREALARRYSGRTVYLRMNIQQEERIPDTVGLKQAGWLQARAPLGCRSTFHLDLTLDETVLRTALSGNWRHNLRRGEERCRTMDVWSDGKPLEALYAVYRESAHRKKMSPAFSLDDVRALRSLLGQSFTLAFCHGDSGEPLAVRGYGAIGRVGHDLIAGVTPQGRKDYASYFLLWRMLNLAKEQGVTLYDLSGVDPEAAGGVFNFKKGLGGRSVTLVGEWEWSNARWARFISNLAIRLRAH